MIKYLALQALLFGAFAALLCGLVYVHELWASGDAQAASRLAVIMAVVGFMMTLVWVAIAYLKAKRQR